MRGRQPEVPRCPLQGVARVQLRFIMRSLQGSAQCSSLDMDTSSLVGIKTAVSDLVASQAGKEDREG